MKEYKIIPDIIMEEFKQVNKELRQNNYKDSFKKLTNRAEDSDYEDKKWKKSEEKRRIKDFYDSYQKLKNSKCNKAKE